MLSSPNTHYEGELLSYKSEQENFWAGEFGDEYILRNDSAKQKSSNIALWCKILDHLEDSSSFLEFGCNIGLNLDALKAINPSFRLGGVEINAKAHSIATSKGHKDVRLGSIVEPFESDAYDVCFISGVLIHINPELLARVYENLVQNSTKFIVVIENYNPTPVEVPYRGNRERLFKRDFAGELMDQFNLTLRGYGFVYHRDRHFPQDDVNWFVLARK
jgi:pseudaminic acid biosynthesis-associated methylase